MVQGRFGHTFGVRVQKVQKVHRVQRVVVAAPPQIIKKGARLAPQVVSKGCVRFAQGATTLRAEGDGGALRHFGESRSAANRKASYCAG